MKKIFFSVFVFVLFSLVVSFTFAAGGSGATNFHATVSYAVDAGAGIAVSWIPENGITYELHRFKEGDNKINKNIQINAVTGNPYIYIDQNIPMNAAYFYRLINKVTGETIAQTDPINLVPKAGGVVSSDAWAGWPSGTAIPGGIGWVSSDTSGTGTKIKYGTFVDSSGLMHGTMWSNLYGWLSFNKEDLEGCPSGTCEARADASGKISGWARFINNSAWVSLRGVAGDGGQYGMCFGAATSDEKSINNISYYSGAACAGDGAQNNTLNGAGWVSGQVAGWMVFGNAESLAGGNALTISPLPPHRVAIRDYKNFSANLDVKWFVNNKLGGDGLTGTVSPNESSANATVVFRGPNAFPSFPQVKLSASTTDPLNPRSAETEVLIVPPYDIGCAAEGDTNIRVFINKNYFDADYSKINPHTAELFVGTKLGVEPDTFVVETKGPEYVHTKLKQKTTYFYELKTTYGDGYRIKTQIVSCKTGETIPLGSATTLSAFSNSPTRIYLNWKDNSRSLAPYEFEVQRMQLTPNALFAPNFEPQSDTSVLIGWAQKTDSTPYEQKLLRSENGGADWKLINITKWNNEMPPTEPVQFSYEDANVDLGRNYQYKLETCSLIVLDDTMYSQPIKGGVGKPSRACVTSDIVTYLHAANGGQKNQVNSFSRFTASIITSANGIVEKVGNSIIDIIDAMGRGIFRTYVALTNLFREDKINIARGATENYDAYFKSVVITKNPVFVDDALSPDSLYVYRVSIFAEEPQWSNFRAAKTMTDAHGGPIENRPICMRNSFCDSSVSGVRNALDTESSEQQCLVNKDCVNVGRSDQGYRER